jgi:NTE family protein
VSPPDRQLAAYCFAQVRVIAPEEEFSDILEFDPAKIGRAIEAGRAAVGREWAAIERLLR